MQTQEIETTQVEVAPPSLEKKRPFHKLVLEKMKERAEESAEGATDVLLVVADTDDSRIEAPAEAPEVKAAVETLSLEQIQAEVRKALNTVLTPELAGRAADVIDQLQTDITVGSPDVKNNLSLLISLVMSNEDVIKAYIETDRQAAADALTQLEADKTTARENGKPESEIAEMTSRQINTTPLDQFCDTLHRLAGQAEDPNIRKTMRSAEASVRFQLAHTLATAKDSRSPNPIAEAFYKIQKRLNDENMTRQAAILNIQAEPIAEPAEEPKETVIDREALIKDLTEQDAIIGARFSDYRRAVTNNKIFPYGSEQFRHYGRLQRAYIHEVDTLKAERVSLGNRLTALKKSAEDSAALVTLQQDYNNLDQKLETLQKQTLANIDTITNEEDSRIVNEFFNLPEKADEAERTTKNILALVAKQNDALEKTNGDTLESIQQQLNGYLTELAQVPETSKRLMALEDIGQRQQEMTTLTARIREIQGALYNLQEQIKRRITTFDSEQRERTYQAEIQQEIQTMQTDLTALKTEIEALNDPRLTTKITDFETTLSQLSNKDKIYIYDINPVKTRLMRLKEKKRVVENQRAQEAKLLEELTTQEQQLQSLSERLQSGDYSSDAHIIASTTRAAIEQARIVNNRDRVNDITDRVQNLAKQLDMEDDGREHLKLAEQLSPGIERLRILRTKLTSFDSDVKYVSFARLLSEEIGRAQNRQDLSQEEINTYLTQVDELEQTVEKYNDPETHQAQQRLFNQIVTLSGKVSEALGQDLNKEERKTLTDLKIEILALKKTADVNNNKGPQLIDKQEVEACKQKVDTFFAQREAAKEQKREQLTILNDLLSKVSSTKANIEKSRPLHTLLANQEWYRSFESNFSRFFDDNMLRIGEPINDRPSLTKDQLDVMIRSATSLNIVLEEHMVPEYQTFIDTCLQSRKNQQEAPTLRSQLDYLKQNMAIFPAEEQQTIRAHIDQLTESLRVISNDIDAQFQTDYATSHIQLPHINERFQDRQEKITAIQKELDTHIAAKAQAEAEQQRLKQEAEAERKRQIAEGIQNLTGLRAQCSELITDIEVKINELGSRKSERFFVMRDEARDLRNDMNSQSNLLNDPIWMRNEQRPITDIVAAYEQKLKDLKVRFETPEEGFFSKLRSNLRKAA